MVNSMGNPGDGRREITWLRQQQGDQRPHHYGPMLQDHPPSLPRWAETKQTAHSRFQIAVIMEPTDLRPHILLLFFSVAVVCYHYIHIYILYTKHVRFF
jgi:hypothetical protein